MAVEPSIDTLGSELRDVRRRLSELRARCDGDESLAAPLDGAIVCVDDALARIAAGESVYQL